MAAPLEPQSALQVFIGLLPVITGGLIGIVGGLSGTAYGRLLQSRQEKKNFLREKIETFVLHLNELDAWLHRLTDLHLFESVQESYEPEPTSKVSALASVYFPALYELSKQLDIRVGEYKLGMLGQRKEMIIAGQKAVDEEYAKLMAKNPNDPQLIEWVKLAQKKGQNTVRETAPEALAEKFQAVLVARNNLLERVREVAKDY